MSSQTTTTTFFASTSKIMIYSGNSQTLPFMGFWSLMWQKKIVITIVVALWKYFLLAVQPSFKISHVNITVVIILCKTNLTPIQPHGIRSPNTLWVYVCWHLHTHGHDSVEAWSSFGLSLKICRCSFELFGGLIPSGYRRRNVFSISLLKIYKPAFGKFTENDTKYA